MKATRGSVGRSVDQPDPAVRFYLFYGPDEAQSRALGNRLVQALGAAKVPLAGAEVKADAGSVAVAAASISLFGEAQVVWVEPAPDDIAGAVQELLDSPVRGNPVVAIGGALRKSAALVKLAEASKAALAFAAYLPEGQDAERMVADAGRRLGLNLSSGVAARIADLCGGDQAIVSRELEKFAVYLDASPHSPRQLEHEAVDALAAESSEGDFLRLADLAMRGDMDALVEGLSRLTSAGSEAIPVIRSLQRRLLMLAPARARVERGERLDAVMTALGKSVFYKDKAPVEAMIRRWNADALAKAAERVGALERNLMFTGVPATEAIGEELVTIARKARASA